MILPLLGAATGSLVIGRVLLTIAALSTIWPFIKPMPTHLPANAENWKKQLQQGDFFAQTRKESLDEMATILKMNRHAILVGPSQVGKSLTAKAFAQAIAKGDYPEFKGKTVFRINTADIVGQQASFLGGGNRILNEISTAMGRHRNNIILVLDEIHMACKSSEKIADQLKTFLDEGGEFPHVIGITTEEEYAKYVKDNHAFSLRFDRVNIENTNQDETLKVLGDTLLRSHSNPLIEEEALEHVYQKASGTVENAPQPSSSLKLLKGCINRTGKAQKSALEKKTTEISNKILSLRTQAAASRGKKINAKMQITELEKQFHELQAGLSHEKKDLDCLFQSKDLLDRVTKEMYLSILKISTIEQTHLNSKNEKQLKLFLLLQLLSRSLETQIQERSKDLGIKVIINRELIDEVAGP